MPDDGDLDLPRILCLHGGGTNARIFRAQCRVISSQLRGIFRLVFAQGPYPAEPGPDVVSVYGEWGPFWAWIPAVIDVGVTDSLVWDALRSAMEEDDRAGASGPWAGVLGFSQGASACANLLLRAQEEPAKYPEFPFRFGVLIAGRPPSSAVALRLKNASLDGAAGLPREVKSLSFWQANVTTRLRIPTIHVHGLQDVNIALHRRLLNDCCDVGSTRVLEWDGGHRVPIKGDVVEALVKLIIATAGDTGVDVGSGVLS
ncbi:hypothetical protein VTK56DRAFT_4107 [Thermocarpiscus australiensis]